ncbi:kunitz-type protease inhibitor 2 [Tachyglossus aculeatus]|uniref:kunitz-type protease inhibitor 2 n=1 Tax=Tachyglossus aculeatus TaxID=9261 RepID=UPI0018F4B83C|nr:kunitz-type protease inhibitor 2 [Tachyglossus aculeatus]
MGAPRPLLALLGLLLLTGAPHAQEESQAAGGDQPLRDQCLGLKVVGRCRASMPRWWYNATAQLCQPFIYGGCGGNDNNFLTQDGCLQACAGPSDNSSDSSSASRRRGEPAAGGVSGPRGTQRTGELDEDTFNYDDRCGASAVIGPCRAAFPRWYFDTQKDTCVAFIYGGCRGNRNNYLTQHDCMATCHGKSTSSSPSPGNLPSSKVAVLAVVLAGMAAALLGVMVVVFVRMARGAQGGAFDAIWTPVDDKEYLVKNAYTL